MTFQYATYCTVHTGTRFVLTVINEMCTFPWKQLLCNLSFSSVSKSVLYNSLLIIVNITIIITSPFSLIVYFGQATKYTRVMRVALGKSDVATRFFSKYKYILFIFPMFDVRQNKLKKLHAPLGHIQQYKSSIKSSSKLLSGDQSNEQSWSSANALTCCSLFKKSVQLVVDLLSRLLKREQKRIGNLKSAVFVQKNDLKAKQMKLSL